MKGFTTVSHLQQVLEIARRYGDFHIEYDKQKPLPVTMVKFISDLVINSFAGFPKVTVSRTHYEREFVTTFRYSKEYLGEEGKGQYGIGLYVPGPASWHCRSILFDESGVPLLVHGRDAAFKIVEDRLASWDESKTAANENIILAHGLMEKHVLCLLLAEMSRTPAQEFFARIGLRSQRIQLLLEDDEGDGYVLRAPPFSCRDEAAGQVLEAIRYTIENWHHHQNLTSQGREAHMVLTS